MGAVSGNFIAKPVLQFTATPYRRDGQLVDGTVIYSYSLQRAQQDGYFKAITFSPVYELDPDEGDTAIAEAAVRKLRDDLANGRNHMVMARCETIDRATALHALYQRLAPEHSPLLVHSDDRRRSRISSTFGRANTASLSALTCSVRVRSAAVEDRCDARHAQEPRRPASIHGAVHTHRRRRHWRRNCYRKHRRSTGVGRTGSLVQRGRGLELASERVQLRATREHAALVEFLAQSRNLSAAADEGDGPTIARSLLQPGLSAVVYQCEAFRPKNFPAAFGESAVVPAAWLHQGTSTLYFVTRREPQVRWSRSKQILDRQWDLFVLHYDPSQKLLYLHSSDTSSLHEELARAVGGKTVKLIHGGPSSAALATSHA